MTLEVWQRAVHEHLMDAFALCKIYVLRARKRRFIQSIDFVLEMTIPWGMDDGEGMVRLTILEAPYDRLANRKSDPRRVKVVVAADARPFQNHTNDPNGIVDVPRFYGALKPWERVPEDAVKQQYRPVSTLTTRMGTYLQEQTQGEPLKDENDGSVSFITLAWSEPLEPL